MNSRDPPSRILLLIVTHLPPTFPLTNDYLFELFKGYGSIKKILIFERGKANKAFVEYFDVNHAISARRDMQGKLLTQNTGRLLIHFSRLRNLDLEVVDNSRGTNYAHKQPPHHREEVEKAQSEAPSIQLRQLEEFLEDDGQDMSPHKKSQSLSDFKAVEEVDKLLNEDDSSIWKWEQPVPNSHFEIRQILSQRPSRMLRVTSIDERVTARMIFNVFNRFGHLEAILYRKKLRYALLQFEDVDNATVAKEILNNCLFFGGNLRIYFNPQEPLQPTSTYDEFLLSSGLRVNPVPLGRTLTFYGVHDLLELQDMIKLVAKIQGTLFINARDQIGVQLNIDYIHRCIRDIEGDCSLLRVRVQGVQNKLDYQIMINQKVIQTSDAFRKEQRQALFNAKRFWKQNEQTPEDNSIETEMCALSLTSAPKQGALHKLCKQFQSFEYYSRPIPIAEYYIRSIPIGVRCFVTSAKGCTKIHTISGLKYSFQSQLPGGSKNNPHGRCILDCYLSATVIYIYDIIEWGKMDLSEQVAEMRYFWIKGNIPNSMEHQDYQFYWIPLQSDLQIVLSGNPYPRSAIAFVKKDSLYVRGVNPDCLIYKCPQTDVEFNEYLGQSLQLGRIQMTLSLHQSRLFTLDGVEIGKYECSDKHKQIVDVWISSTDLCILKVTQSMKMIEDPYSKLHFWQLLPKLVVH